MVTLIARLPVVIFSSFLMLFIIDVVPLYATITEGATGNNNAAPTSEQPKPGTLIVITFENGTTKVVRSTSTNVLPVTGGYLIVDPTVVPSQPLPAKSISQSVVNQFNTAISIVYSIITSPLPPPLPPPIQPPLPTDCPEGEILQGDECVPGFAPCGPEWGNPCPGTEPEPTPEPVAPQQPVELEPEPEPEPDPSEGNQGEEENQNENSDGGDSDGSTEGEGDSSGEEGSEE
ncbi:MAG: hypothetical protein GEU26_12810 [Nitrososphaeraceae archaeon]|nr:hypothetical protein [Nitrososphaeraceae archaeon]